MELGHLQRYLPRDLCVIELEECVRSCGGGGGRKYGGIPQ